ncbi:MAG: hypothetical protein G8345_20305, partial [Magnetococcales bacterium]|nr:hypothetical protein [Magnetococcales bacterium]
MLPRQTRSHPSAGMSLAELMISMGIGLFLLSGVVTVLYNTKLTYKVNEGVSLLQQNARYIIDELNKQMRMAGYYGCAYKQDIPTNSDGSSVHNTLKNASSTEYNFGTAIEVWNASNTSLGGSYTITATNPSGSSILSNWNNASGSQLPSMLSGLVIPGTDVIIIRGAGGDEIPLAKNNNAAQLFACTSATASACSGGGTSYSGLCEQDIVVASDCTNAWIFQISNMQTTGQDTCTSGQMTNIVHSGTAMTPGNEDTSWGGGSVSDYDTLGSEASIMKIGTTAYYVGVGTSGSPALYRKSATGTAE